ncbi:hypothetical protein HMPREF9431_00208 [Segatella oulorum F0390]|uniref:ACT domain-containing protein n=2 Tax=Segatella oulorum TaxID=28136 RepID=G1W8Q7_9BACT|nr:hypothetical protein HMPREF9431_00208 [Segatella oulorum F0390]
MLCDLAEVLSEQLGLYIRNVSIGTNEGIFEGKIDVRVHNRNEVGTIITQLKGIDGLQEVTQIM